MDANALLREARDAIGNVLNARWRPEGMSEEHADALRSTHDALDAYLSQAPAGGESERDTLNRLARKFDLDNHHNAALCPYCTPAGGAPAPFADLAARQTTLGPEINAVLAKHGSALYEGAPAPTPRADAGGLSKFREAAMEERIEQAFWEFDAERKRTGAERDAFKGQFRRIIRAYVSASALRQHEAAAPPAAAVGQEPRWRPIESAPLNVEFVLVFNGKWRGVARRDSAKYPDDWWGEDGSAVVPLPTHWMPLPPAPSVDEHLPDLGSHGPAASISSSASLDHEVPALSVLSSVA